VARSSHRHFNQFGIQLPFQDLRILNRHKRQIKSRKKTYLGHLRCILKKAFFLPRSSLYQQTDLKSWSYIFISFVRLQNRAQTTHQRIVPPLYMVWNEASILRSKRTPNQRLSFTLHLLKIPRMLSQKCLHKYCHRTHSKCFQTRHLDVCKFW